ncbi:MAG: CocE/NonD family hydrolase [Acidobacteria bacterium]|nr:CocE/NonD family hydrolase [Acidobacteriota bacterium]
MCHDIFHTMRLFLTLTVAATLSAQPKTLPVAEQYTKYEFRIPMRDGVKLYTAVYQPKDAFKKYPLLLTRTPYSCQPYGADRYRDTLGPSRFLQTAGYIFVYQDVRGRYRSEGVFEQVRPHKPVKSGPKDFDESTDTFDTIDWLVKNLPNNNGRVGMWGISYPGFYTSMGMIDAHPALKAASPQAPVGDWFIGDDWRHNGAFFLAHAVRWMYSNDRDTQADPDTARKNPDYPAPDGYSLFLKMGTLEEINEKLLKNSVPYWKDLVDHSTYDAFWKARDVRPHLTKLKPAILTVGGWFDAEDLFGTLETYKKAEANNPGAQNFLVMGPWYHGQWSSNDGAQLGDIRFRQNTSLWYQEHVEKPFFERILRDEKPAGLAEAVVFETGANQWRHLDAWPPKEVTAKTIHLQPNGRLGWNPPSLGGYEEYVSDPARPVPSVPYIANTMTVEYMLDDQRQAATRPDVLVFSTDSLEEDLTLAGPLDVTLHVSTTGTDSDFVVKVIDVYPDNFPDPDPNPKRVKMGGYQQLVRGEPFRGKFRKSFEKPEPFPPGQMEKISFTMPDVFHTFRSGHKLMVQIQSSWFPLVDRNPQKFMEIGKAKLGDFQKATQRIYYGTVGGSSIGVRVLTRSATK